MTRTVFLTGASSGLGRGLALHYAREGCTVHAAARRGDELRRVAEEARGAPGRVVPIAVDVTDSEALVSAVREAERASGGALDLVIANAGGSIPQPAAHLDWRAVASQLDVNARAACVTLTAALPAMLGRRSGTLVGISSLAALRGLPGRAAYSAAKSALAVFMESLRVDLRGSGIRAVCVHPGFVRTPGTAKLSEPMPFAMDVDRAVQLIARGIARGQRRILFPRPTATAMRLLHVLPDGLYERVAQRMRPP